MPGKHRRVGDAQRPAGRGARLAVVLAVLVLTAVAGVGTVLGVPSIHQWFAGAGVEATSPPPAPTAVEPALRPVETHAPAPTPAGVAAVLDPQVEGLGALSGRVVDPVSGTVLWDRDPAAALVPGSTAKLLTAAAALLVLDHDATFTTSVVAGVEPGTVVLVGGGDPTLSSMPAGEESVYPGAARLDDLVAQVRAAATGPVHRVLVDVGRYSGDVLAPGWLPADVPGGFVAPIVPVMLDGARADPGQESAPRSGTPAQDAAAELARRLGADPAGSVVGVAAPDARVLGVVHSPPVDNLVTTVLGASDNVLAETLAREVALATGAQPSFTGAAGAVLGVLARHGFDIASTTLLDGSGLSTGDRVSATLLTGLLATAAAPTKGPAGSPADGPARTAELRPILVALPVAGGTGTLADRYEGPGATAGRGWVRAKTGTLTAVNSLAGIVLDVDGRLMVFALLSNGPDPSIARPRLDGMAAALRSCGCR
ncbi:MAG: D-alanyl-D-alanine carboxypeptidase/D-alanyl-D-alanine-endopeptidase [Actinomycetota bacterium]|nr:D-alanyl-D-alanine carboxypeptidase/D-alanyl-D-alanine-endopeptidase [Actinomycetota bacterium]